MTAHSNPILSSIIAISDKVKGSGLKDSVLQEIDESLIKLSNFLCIDKTEALFFALIFALQNQDNTNVSLHVIAKYLEYPFLNLLEYRYVIDLLEDKSLISMNERLNVSHHPENNGYIVPASVSNSVIEGKDMVFPKKEQMTLEDAVSEIVGIENSYMKNIMNEIEYNRQIVLFEQKNQHIDLIRNVTSMFPEDFDSRILLYYFCYFTIYGEEAGEPVYKRGRYETTVFNMLSNAACVRRRSDFFSRNDTLIKEEYLEKYRNENFPRFGTVISFRLTEGGVKKLFGKDAGRFSRNEELSELDWIISGIKELSEGYEERNPIKYKLGNLIRIEESYSKYEYFKTVKRIIKDDTSRFIYLDCVSDSLKGYNSELGRTLQNIYGHSPDYFCELRNFCDEKHFLVESGLIEIIKDDEVIERSRMALTDKSLELLYGENADLYKKRDMLKNIQRPEDLKERQLFYESEIQNQIEMLSNSLKQENLINIQNRLESKGLNKGFAVILYGAPGTGKTETVYQLAKKTNRKILHVDISESKSMWFGESEKCIKKIFSNYRSLCKSCKNHGENTPILLFNEADAIISKRGSLEGGGPRQTENAMQNILLEEMEKLDGIMIATTNLSENMDAAFERRFLFKIKFEKPGIEARSKIWMSKLESISNEDACLLARQFDFSGGEIDNIVRKSEMNEIITGNNPDYDYLVELCKQERLKTEGERRMGFMC